MSKLKPKSLTKKLVLDKFNEAYTACAEADQLSGRKAKDRVCPPKGKSAKFNSLINTREVKRTVFDSIKSEYETFIREYLGEDELKELALEDDISFKPKTVRGMKPKTDVVVKPLKSLNITSEVENQILPDTSEDKLNKVKGKTPDSLDKIIPKNPLESWKERVILVNPYNEEIDPSEIEKYEMDSELNLSLGMRGRKNKQNIKLVKNYEFNPLTMTVMRDNKIKTDNDRKISVSKWLERH